ncbi:MAG: rhodanese-like domain-containing protein [Magnetococcales bacterium]|nr:rhodanese-like domain-containing protein [Magnetococcales bacterium]
MMTRPFFALLFLLLTLLGCSQAPYTNVDNNGLKELQAKGVPLYDIRRPEEWKQTGVIAGSRLLTFVDEKGQLKPDFIDRFSKEVAKDAPVVLICRTGNRTDFLARHLMEKMGYTKVYNVQNGITDWLKAGLPVVAP